MVFDTAICGICWDPQNPKRTRKRRVTKLTKLTKLKCGHAFCLRCVKSHVKWNILDPDESAGWGYPKCPAYHCNHRIRNKQYFTKKLLEIVKKQIRLQSQLNKRVRHCPVIDCTGVIQKFGKDDERCTVCLVVICKTCHNAKLTNSRSTNSKYGLRSKHVCSESEKMSLSQRLLFVKCPRCDTLIQKNGGCDEVFCVVCEVNFDYEVGRIINV